MDVQYRELPAPLEVRSLPQRILAGPIIPLGVDRQVDPYTVERFDPPASRHQYKAADRIVLRAGHSNAPGSLLLGRCLELDEADGSLCAQFRVVQSEIGDHWLALAREHVIGAVQWSIGFVPFKTRMDGRTTVHTRADLFETALVGEGAYGPAAQVMSVRATLGKLKNWLSP